MPKITALIHANNDALRLGRLLDSLRPCDEVIVVVHSQDDTEKVAKQHGAKVIRGILGVNPGTFVVDASYDWVLCLQPSEALHETLEAALFEWKEREEDALTAPGFQVNVREEADGGWAERPAEARLVNRTRVNWSDELPPPIPDAETLSGYLMRFAEPGSQEDSSPIQASA